jgi:hypothetical protein
MALAPPSELRCKEIVEIRFCLSERISDVPISPEEPVTKTLFALIPIAQRYDADCEAAALEKCSWKRKLFCCGQHL